MDTKESRMPSTKVSKRRNALSLPALLGAAALALSACSAGGASASQATDGAPVKGGTFVFAEVTPINNFQTQAARFYEKANVLNSVLDRLTYFDAQKGELVPWIASKFTASEDQTRFTFTIRPA